MLRSVAQIIPPLLETSHKGQSGRIGVLGGCEEYTGAPFFAAMSALRLGADLAHIFCEESAAFAIKSYSPELIVHPYIYKATSLESKGLTIEKAIERIAEFLPRLHSVVIGPGLGRDLKVLETAERVVLKAKELNIPLVFDADGLFLLQQSPELIKGYKSVILTPNAVEFDRLCTKMGIQRNTNPEDEISALARAMGGPTIVQKGLIDYISNGNSTIKCEANGSPRRCGGQGDILSGTMTTFSAWASIYEKEHKVDSINGISIPMLAAYGACCITRHASSVAFKKLGRSYLASDLIPEIHPVFQSLFTSSL